MDRQGDDGKQGELPRLLVSIDAGPESDPEEVAELSRRLRVELLRLEVESVTPVPGPPPPAGAKAGDPVSWSTLLLTLAASGGVLTTVIGALRDWLLRQPTSPTIEVSIGGDSIKLESSSIEERQQIIDTFIARHDPQRQ
jgi:hypothetical protein